MNIYISTAVVARGNDETIDIPKEGWGSNPEDLEWGQNGGTISGNSQQGNAGITNFPRCGWWS